MFGLRFTRPTGAAADVKELEYIIALHQTSLETRPNATVSSHDIRALLQSRYSLQISHEQALQVVRALGGGGNNNNDNHESMEDEPKDTTASPQNSSSPDPQQAHETHHMWDGIWHTVVHGLSHPFAKEEEENNSASKVPPVVETVNEESSSVPLQNTNQQKLSTISKKSVQATLSMLQKLHHTTSNVMSSVGSNRTHHSSQLHHNLASDNHQAAMSLLLQEKVKADLRQQLTFQHTQHAAVRHLDNTSSNNNTNQDDDDDDKEEEIVFEHTNYEDPSSSNNNNAPEFLDLVQILCTLLIPTISRMCHHAQTQLDALDEDNDGQSFQTCNDEAPAESPLQKVQEKVQRYIPCSGQVMQIIWGTLSKLALRIYRLFRARLQIVDDDTSAFLKALSESQLVQIGHKALLKDLPFDTPPLVDEALVQYLLISHGEVERANNLPLVRAMVDMAQIDGGAMDERALIQALTQDLGPWDPLAEDTPKTFFADVFPGERLPSRKTQLEAATASGQPSENGSDSPEKLVGNESPKVAVDATTEPTKKKELNDELDDMESNVSPKRGRGLFCCCRKTNDVTYLSGKQSAYDMVIDSYSSLLVTVFIWIFYFMNVFMYGTPIIQYASSIDFGPDFWHKILETVWSWAVIAIVLSGFGLLFMIPLSSGNKPSRRSVRWQVVAALFAAFYALGPYTGFRIYKIYAEGDPDFPEWTTQANEEQITLFSGLIIVGLCIFQIFFIVLGWIFPKMADPHQSLWQPFKALSGYSFAHNEAYAYSASKKKTEKLLANAFKMHVLNDALAVKTASQFKAQALSSNKQDQVNRNFILYGEESEPVGGIVWTWWRFFDGWVSSDEGIWISTRLVITQVGTLSAHCCSAHTWCLTVSF